ncbi:hypothetical protein D049_0949, partial [Vibrio parahaemolyticus VPTS-2010]
LITNFIAAVFFDVMYQHLTVNISKLTSRAIETNTTSNIPVTTEFTVSARNKVGVFCKVRSELATKSTRASAHAKFHHVVVEIICMCG